MTSVILQTVSNIQKITLNRPKALNSLNLEMVRALYPKYQEWSVDSNTKAILMKGSGEKAFCAGGDITAIYHSGTSGDGSVCKSFFKEEYKLNHIIGTINKPHIALLNGITMGGGVGLSIHGKYRIATNNTVFAMPETGIGFFCDVGGSYFLSRLPNNIGMYLALTGARLKSKDLLNAGVATHFLENEKIEQFENNLIESSNSIEDILNENCETKKSDTEFVSSIEKIDKIFGKNSVEEIIEELKKDNTEWSQKILNNLSKMSPTSVKVVYKQLKEGAKRDLGDCLKMEYTISQGFMRNKDFFEGVRALLIDKDQNPKWNPKSLELITNDMVNDYFDENKVESPLVFDQEIPKL